MKFTIFFLHQHRYLLYVQVVHTDINHVLKNAHTKAQKTITLLPSSVHTIFKSHFQLIMIKNHPLKIEVKYAYMFSSVNHLGVGGIAICKNKYNIILNIRPF